MNKAVAVLSTIVDWPMIAADKLGLIKQYQYTTRTGSKLICRSKSTDINEVVVIFSGEEYPRSELQLQNNAVVFDLGANIGSFPIYLDDCNPDISWTCHSFEPFPDNYDLLERNIMANELQAKVVCRKEAIAGSDGEAVLDAAMGFDAVSISNTVGESGVRVPTLRLSSYAKKHGVTRVDLLKIDVEGAEYDIFTADYAWIRDHSRYLIIEAHPIGENTVEVIRAIISPDFEIIPRVTHNTNVLFARRKQ
jgi:FkbM family methyltransferase